MTDEIHNMSHSHVREVAASMDAYLLEFFGSEENVKQFAHLYVLETKHPEIITEPDFEKNAFKMLMSTEYRLRLKTEKELAAEKTPEGS